MYCALSGDNIYVYVVVIGTKLIQLLTIFLKCIYIYLCFITFYICHHMSVSSIT